MGCFNKTEVLDTSLQLLNLVTAIPIFFFGILCNALALWVFCCKVKTRTDTTVYMINLIISDIMVLLTFPFRMYAYMHSWDLGSETCKALLTLYYINRYMSIFIITAIAFDRYIAIRHPLKFKHWRSPLKATIVCSVLWSVLTAIGVITVLQSKGYTLSTCFQKVTTEPLNLALVFVVVGFGIPLILLSYFSGHVLIILCSKETSEVSERRTIRKAMNIIISNLVVFVICFLPIHVGYTIRFVTDSLNSSCLMRERVNVYIHVATLLANSNCVLDSVCYFFVASEFWESMFAE
ncbi:G-protein coupled receptor 35-like [Spea bombifrons]|uniref:G-protein coupled receptor 35-like n=1 Tax=Spea bombifrons TaxID=233779 RepID=UPI00234BD445|nr:G-protein coupled receptor 35-like [Spea bombifrons]